MDRFYLGKPLIGILMLISSVIIPVTTLVSFRLLGFLRFVMRVWVAHRRRIVAGRHYGIVYRVLGARR